MLTVLSRSHLRKSSLQPLLVALLAVWAGAASAQSYGVALSGSQVVAGSSALAAPQHGTVINAPFKNGPITVPLAKWASSVSTSAAGSGLLTLDPSLRLHFDVSLGGLGSSETSAHIHVGDPGTNGSTLFSLPLGTTKTGVLGPLTTEQVADLNAGRWYVDIHTSASPAGELRGQMVQASVFQGLPHIPLPNSTLSLSGAGLVALPIDPNGEFGFLVILPSVRSWEATRVDFIDPQTAPAGAFRETILRGTVDGGEEQFLVKSRMEVESSVLLLTGGFGRSGEMTTTLLCQGQVVNPNAGPGPYSSLVERCPSTGWVEHYEGDDKGETKCDTGPKPVEPKPT